MSDNTAALLSIVVSVVFLLLFFGSDIIKLIRDRRKRK